MWFRSDLRIHDNPALSAASLFAGRLGVVGLFLIDLSAWKRHDVSPVKQDFILRTVRALCSDLAEIGIPLNVVTIADDAVKPETVVLEMARSMDAQAVFWNVEYEVDESARDRVVEQTLEKAGYLCRSFHDQCAVRPGEVLTKEGDRPYTVFTPFKKAWINYLKGHPIELRTVSLPSGPVARADGLGEMPSVEIPSNFLLDQIRRDWPAGEQEALSRLEGFCSSEQLSAYKKTRDFPALGQTSRLSAYLAVGAISVRQCLKRALEGNQGRFDAGSEGAVSWINELCWRDFYRHILVHFDRVCRGRPFQAATEQIPWRYYSDEDAAGRADFEAWCAGRTGYPLVDAAMRCLLATGWMHNRLRMLTAMFLSKHLLIWWPRGERHFALHLIDGDFASNNGGWQWSASTGTDAQPYFRIFNPITQSERFDPDGSFIRQWVPELAAVKAPAIHFPAERLSDPDFGRLGYPRPIVEHKSARERCLAAFTKVMKRS